DSPQVADIEAFPALADPTRPPHRRGTAPRAAGQRHRRVGQDLPSRNDGQVAVPLAEQRTRARRTCLERPLQSRPKVVIERTYRAHVEELLDPGSTCDGERFKSGSA